MRQFGFAVLYTALMFGANPAAADIAAADAARDGDMRKLGFHSEPKDLPDEALVGLDDAPRALAEFHGKWVVLNFWATWCPPCRHEMPGLDKVQADMGGADLVVVTVATGRNPVPAMEKFFTEAGVAHVEKLRDPQSALARKMGVVGLPMTVILDPEGREVGRLIGDAEWDGADARKVLAALTGG